MMTVPTLIGEVVSDGMNKSAVILIQRLIKHPIYKKFIKKKSKISIHDKNNDCSKGDIVEIKQCAPVSKTKSWVLVKIIKKFVI